MPEIDPREDAAAEAPPEKDVNDLFSQVAERVALATIEKALSDPRFRLKHEDHGLEPPIKVFESIADELDRPGALDKAAKYPTGIHILDAALGGGVVQSGLTVIAGRTSCGKSSLLRNLAARMAGFGVCYTSLEDDESDTRRKLCTIFGDGNLEDGFHRLRAERPRLFINHIVTDTELLIKEIEKRRERDGVSVANIDQLSWLHMDMDADTYREASACIMALKLCAKRNRMALIVAAQINRAGARAEVDGERIGLHHLRDSGRIEEAADAVLVIQGLDAQTGRMELDVLKNRQGARDQTMSVTLDFPSGRILEDASCPTPVTMSAEQKKRSTKAKATVPDMTLDEFCAAFLTEHWLYKRDVTGNVIAAHDCGEKVAERFVNKVLAPCNLNIIPADDESIHDFGALQVTRLGAHGKGMFFRRAPAG